MKVHSEDFLHKIIYVLLLTNHPPWQQIFHVLLKLPVRFRHDIINKHYWQKVCLTDCCMFSWYTPTSNLWHPSSLHRCRIVYDRQEWCHRAAIESVTNGRENGPWTMHHVLFFLFSVGIESEDNFEKLFCFVIYKCHMPIAKLILPCSLGINVLSIHPACKGFFEVHCFFWLNKGETSIVTWSVDRKAMNG